MKNIFSIYFVLAISIFVVSCDRSNSSPSTEKIQHSQRINTKSITLQIEPQFSEAHHFSDGLAAVKVGGMYGYIDKTGKFLINPKYSSAEDFSEGLAAVRMRNSDGIYKSGFIDKSGKVIIKFEYDYANNFKEGLALVKIGSLNNYKIGFINAKGEMVIKAIYDDGKDFSDGLAVVGVGKEFDSMKYGYIDKKGIFKIIPKYALALSFSEDRAIVVDEKKSKSKGIVIDKSGVAIKDNLYLAGNFSEGLLWIDIGEKGNNKVGFINSNGSFIIDPQFGWAKDFSDGLAAVRVGDEKSGKYGYIDKKGFFGINPVFSDAHSFSHGVAAVKKPGDDYYTLIDKSGASVSNFKFQSHKYNHHELLFKENMMSVLFNENYGYLLLK